MSDIKLPHDHGNYGQCVACQTPCLAEFQALADSFKQLGDGSRLRIFWLLCHCEECVINISAMVEMSSPAVSHHLKQLKSAGFIVSRREGKEVYYTAADTDRSRLLHNMMKQLLTLDCSGHCHFE